MKTRRGTRLGQTESTPAPDLHANEQERIKSLLRQELQKYGGSPMDLSQVRSLLEERLGNTSLSGLVISFREEAIE